MSTLNPQTVVVESTEQKQTEFTPNFGAGRYSKAAHEFWKDLQRLLKISPQGAEKISQHWMREFGAAMKNVIVNASVTGKYSSDGELTLKEACKAKVVATYPISLARLCSYLDGALAFGILPNKCQYTLKEELAKYIAENESAK